MASEFGKKNPTGFRIQAVTANKERVGVRLRWGRLAHCWVQSPVLRKWAVPGCWSKLGFRRPCKEEVGSSVLC